MLEREKIEKVLVATAKKEGHSLNGQEKLMLRMKVSSALSGLKKKINYEQDKGRSFTWEKPAGPRR